MVYAESNLTVPVRPANTRVMIALCVSCTLKPQPEVPSVKSTTVIGKCGHSFHMVRSYSYTMALVDDAELD